MSSLPSGLPPATRAQIRLDLLLKPVGAKFPTSAEGWLERVADSAALPTSDRFEVLTQAHVAASVLHGFAGHQMGGFVAEDDTALNAASRATRVDAEALTEAIVGAVTAMGPRVMAHFALVTSAANIR